MIIKKVLSKKQTNSSFKGLSNYILDTNNNHAKILADYMLDQNNNMEKVESYYFSNCSFEKDEDNINEIINTQKLNTTTKQDKTLHLIVSFQEQEKPTIETMREIEKEIAKSLGMEEHQRLSVVHSNTNNLHIHIAINKINPKTLKVVNPFNDVKILQETAVKLEKKYNLALDNHITNKEKKQNKYNTHTMTYNFESWVKEKISDKVSELLQENTTTFNDIKKLLAEYDLEFRERRNGFVIASKSNKLFCKASSVHRQLSKQNLQKRFKNLDLNIDTINITPKEKFNKFESFTRSILWEKYQENEKEKSIKLQQELAEIRLKRNEFRKYINSSKSNIKNFNFVKNQRDIFKNQTREIYKKYKKKSYRDFLLDEAYKGNKEAIKILQYKNNKRLKEQDNDVLQGNIKEYQLYEKPFYITKEGFIVYKNNLNKIIDKKDHIKIVFNDKEKEEQTILNALKIAMQKYDNLKINGNNEFRNKVINLVVKNNLEVTFEDKFLNRQIQELRKNPQQINRNTGFSFW